MRRIGAALAALGAAAALSGATPAAAKSPRDQMFPTDSSCYLRDYGVAHLAAHPVQRVTLIALGPWAPEWGDPRFVAVKLVLALRGSPEVLEAVAYCENEAGHLYCQIEGDGGGFVLEPRRGGVRLTVSSQGMWFEGAQDFVEISGTSGDDRVFVLPAVPADACP